MTKLSYSNKPDISPLDEDFAKKVAEFIRRYKLSKEKGSLLFRSIRTARDYYVTSGAFSNLDAMDNKLSKARKKLISKGELFLETFDEWIEVYDSVDQEKAIEAKGRVQQTLTTIQSTKNPKVVKLPKGKKREAGKMAALIPLAAGYQKVFGKKPGISKNSNSLTKRGHFHFFYETAMSLITGSKFEEPQSTLQEALDSCLSGKSFKDFLKAS